MGQRSVHYIEAGRMGRLMDIVLEKSLINVHCKGVDSIVVKDAPGMVRIFVARQDHELWRNDPDRRVSQVVIPLGDDTWSVALHKHHCDVTLMPILGDVYNVMGTPNVQAETTLMRPYRYKTPIGSHEGKFELLDTTWINLHLMKYPLTGPKFLKANIPHSVYVPKNRPAAWWIWEGAEDPNYMPTVWSNDELENFSFEGYNLPMTEERLQETLQLIGVRR